MNITKFSSACKAFQSECVRIMGANNPAIGADYVPSKDDYLLTFKGSTDSAKGVRGFIGGRERLQEVACKIHNEATGEEREPAEFVQEIYNAWKSLLNGGNPNEGTRAPTYSLPYLEQKFDEYFADPETWEADAKEILAERERREKRNVKSRKPASVAKLTAEYENETLDVLRIIQMVKERV